MSIVNYLELFNSIENIDNEIHMLYLKIDKFNETKKYANYINNYVDNYDPNIQVKFSLNETNIFNLDILDEFDNYKKALINKNNNFKLNLINSKPDLEFQLIENTIIKIVRFLIGFNNLVDKPVHELESKIFIISRKSNLINSIIDTCINDLQIKYLETINFIKEQKVKISYYPIDYESNNQKKIIELLKKRFDIIQ